MDGWCRQWIKLQPVPDSERTDTAKMSVTVRNQYKSMGQRRRCNQNVGIPNELAAHVQIGIDGSSLPDNNIRPPGL